MANYGPRWDPLRKKFWPLPLCFDGYLAAFYPGGVPKHWVASPLADTLSRTFFGRPSLGWVGTLNMSADTYVKEGGKWVSLSWANRTPWPRVRNGGAS